jgi:hypothetical protein
MSEGKMSGRLIALAIGLLGALLLLMASGCAKPIEPPIVVEPTTVLLFDPAPAGWPDATQIGRSDWPSAAGPVEGPEYGAYQVTIYDWQGGAGWGWGWGGWNNYMRYFRGYRVGSSVR